MKVMIIMMSRIWWLYWDGNDDREGYKYDNGHDGDTDDDDDSDHDRDEDIDNNNDDIDDDEGSDVDNYDAEKKVP